MTAPQLWDAAARLGEAEGDFWQQMEGGENAVIMAKTDTSKGRGQIMNVRTRSILTGEPHFGSETFDTASDFEQPQYGEYSVTVGVIRHAISADELAEENTGMRGEIISGFPTMLGEWLGRRKTEETDMLLRDVAGASSENLLFPRGKSENTLAATDGLSWDLISTGTSLLGRMGGIPTPIYKGGGKQGHVVVACDAAVTQFKQTSDYKQLARDAGARGPVNPLFSGDVVNIDGVSIISRTIIDHDGIGAIGSPMNPRARLGEAITAGTTTFDIKGGGNATDAARTEKLYFKHFRNYAYKLSTATTIGGSTALTRYCLIINPPNAATDPNKIGMYSYTTGNNGNKITIVNRLGSAASGARVTTLGDVVWNTGVWSGVHTDVHPVGALVIPCNSRGEPIGWSYVVAKTALLRAYGKYRNKRGEETEEDGFVQKRYIRSYYGHKIRQDRQGRYPSVLVLEHSLHYPDLPLPTVV